MSSLATFAHLPNNMLRKILKQRLDGLSNNLYNNYQANTNPLYNYNSKPLAYLSKYFKEHGRLYSKENKKYIRQKFTKHILQDKLILLILTEVRKMGATFNEEKKERKRLNTNKVYFEQWANPSWISVPPRTWMSLWKKYKAL